MNILQLSSWFGAQYRVLRCAAAGGGEITVAGPEGARALAKSRYCKRFVPLSFEGAACATAADIDTYARRYNIDLVIPSDAVTTRFLSTIAKDLQTPHFPVPETAAFDRLVSKDRFMKLCAELDVPHPRGEMFERREDVQMALAQGRLHLPAMAKPVNLSGGTGVTLITQENSRQALAAIDYAPVLMQDFIVGEDLSITVFCRDGEITKQVVFSHPHGVFRFIRQPELEAITAYIVKTMNLSGVINFDARIAADNKVWMIECNPRFYFNMDVAMVAGVNFARLDDLTPNVPPCEIKVPQASFADFLRMRFPSANDRKMLRHWISDPVILALVIMGYQPYWHMFGHGLWSLALNVPDLT